MSAEGGEKIACPLRAAARRAPEDVALIDAAGSLTFGAMDGWVEALAGELEARDVSEGDVVALLLPNGRLAVALLLAVMRCGAVVCPLHGRNPPAMLREQLGRVGAGVLIGARVGTVEGVRCLSAVDLEGNNNGAPEPGSERRVRRPRPTLAGKSCLPLIECNRPATMMFTSGSVAVPKVAVHSLWNHVAAARASNRFHGLGATDRWLLSLPLCHVGGLAIVFRCLLAGAGILIPEQGVELAEAIARFKPTQLSLVPTQFRRLLAKPAVFGPEVRCILLGGAPAPDGLVTEALARGLPVRKTYGLTEMTSQVTAVPPGASGAESMTAGRLLEGCELRLAADGEILVRGPALFLGYGEGGRIVRPVDEEGWFATGDLGRVAGAGWLTVSGRKDFLFISGGENIQPEEIEAALLGLGEVAQAVVVPVPDVEFGQRPAAFVRMHGGAEVDAARLADALRQRIPRYKIPVVFYALPDDDGARALKVRRRELAEEARRRVLASETTE